MPISWCTEPWRAQLRVDVNGCRRVARVRGCAGDANLAIAKELSEFTGAFFLRQFSPDQHHDTDFLSSCRRPDHP